MISEFGPSKARLLFEYLSWMWLWWWWWLDEHGFPQFNEIGWYKKQTKKHLLKHTVVKKSGWSLSGVYEQLCAQRGWGV